jgi:hypothetical protein
LFFIKKLKNALPRTEHVTVPLSLLARLGGYLGGIMGFQAGYAKTCLWTGQYLGLANTIPLLIYKFHRKEFIQANLGQKIKKSMLP